MAALAPVDRLATLVDHAAFVHRGEDLDVASLVAVLERQVGIAPIAAHSQPLELLALYVDELEGPIATELAKLRLRDLRHLVRPELLLDLMLDGLAVAVPAWNVGCVEAAHRLVLHDEVFEYLVVRRTHVDMTVGVRRAVVEQKHGSASA